MAGSRCPSSLRFLALFFALLDLGRSTMQVPAIIWSTDSLPPLAPPAAGHITPIDQMLSYLDSAFGSTAHNVLVFLQERLSKDDFTRYGGVYGNPQDSAFKNLEAALQSSSSAVTFPALESGHYDTILSMLQEKLGTKPLFVRADSLPGYPINASVSNVLLVKLPYCNRLSKPCKEVQHESDEIVGKILKAMKAKNVSYTAIYTGIQPSRIIQDQYQFEEPVGRTLLQAPPPTVKPPIMYNSSAGPCIMLWARSLNVSLSRTSAWIDLAEQEPTVVLADSMCNITNSRLVLSYASGYTLRFTLSQRFYPVSARNWSTLESVELQFGGTTATFIGRRNIYTPVEYSYHCGTVSSFQDALLVPNGTNQTISDWRLNFIDFQIQGFRLDNGTNFSYASDCAGFFTAGIWMGLLTSLLMLLIFVYGLHMIMQLNTMDRFDDPKGPSISVPQSE